MKRSPTICLGRLQGGYVWNMASNQQFSQAKTHIIWLESYLENFAMHSIA